jgi:predicted ATP-dependent endonuclease of OLD family
MAHITSLSITDFKGFYQTQTILFAIPTNKAGSGLTIIVGPNNAGKTTIIDAIKKFYVDNPPQFDREVRHGNKPVVLKLDNSNGESKSILTTAGAIGTRDGDKLYPTQADISLINSRRYFSDYFSPTIMQANTHKRSSLRLNRIDVDNDFGRFMIAIDLNTEQKKDFNSLMKRLIPHFSSWNVELSRGSNYIRYVTGTSDEHSSEFFGDGIISLFKIAAYLVSGTPNEILVIDEPELSLHPQAQKILAKILSEQAMNKQILVTSHSPYFVNWEDIANGAKVIRLNKIADKACTVHLLGQEVIDHLLPQNEDWRKPQLLDTVAKEIFFATNIVFVEGLEDMSLIKRFVSDNKIELQFEIFGYGAGGAANIQNLLLMCKQLGIKAGALFDGKEADHIRNAKAAFPDFCIQHISTDDIRDKTDKNIVGLFAENGQIKREHGGELNIILHDFNQYFIK